MGVPIQVISTITVATAAGGTQLTSSSILAGVVYLEADEGNGTGKIYIGDVNVSATNYMTVLGITATSVAGGDTIKGIWVKAPYPERPDASQLQLKSFYAIASATGCKLHVTYFERLGNK